MKCIFWASCCVLLLSSACLAHVGSPDVFYEGTAGPYRLFVTVRTPAMVPGIAKIDVRALDGGVSGIDIVPLRAVGEGSANAPPPDHMEHSPTGTNNFTGKLWLMQSGSWQIRLEVFGRDGKGEMAVPVEAAARRTLTMQKGLGALLIGLMTFLAFALVSILGAAVRESPLEPGSTPTPGTLRRGRIAIGVTAVVVAAILFLGNKWWNAAAAARADLMLYKAPPLTVALVNHDTLDLKMGFSAWHDRRKAMLLDRIIPDHGHLMHTFLVRIPEMDRFYHLHPEREGPDTFSEKLPAVAAGDYEIFADVVRESGFADTMTARITLPEVRGQAIKEDDSAAEASSIKSALARATVPLEGGGSAEWILGGPPVHSGIPMILRFRVRDQNNNPATDLQPYMGMAGHLIVVKHDMSVFAHVHPVGSVPMAAVMLLEKGETVAGKEMGDMSNTHHTALSDEVTFPYGFPQRGDYRLFMQIKRNGRVQTGVFDVHVES